MWTVAAAPLSIAVGPGGGTHRASHAVAAPTPSPRIEAVVSVGEICERG